jgi:hypothetical protein
MSAIMNEGTLYMLYSMGKEYIWCTRAEARWRNSTDHGVNR